MKGQESTVTDIDGNIYHTIKIGNQEWLVENLKSTRYCNGDLIGTTNWENEDITDEVNPKYQWALDDDEDNVIKFGRLYTWHAAVDKRKIAPIGWRVPTLKDWSKLISYLIANEYNYDRTITGNKIAKSLAAKSLWKDDVSDWERDTYSYGLTIVRQNRFEGAIGDDLSINNKSGFTALPGGCRYKNGVYNHSSYGAWWSSTKDFSDTAYYFSLRNYCSDFYLTNENLKAGLSIRCIKINR